MYKMLTDGSQMWINWLTFTKADESCHFHCNLSMYLFKMKKNLLVHVIPIVFLCYLKLSCLSLLSKTLKHPRCLSSEPSNSILSLYLFHQLVGGLLNWCWLIARPCDIHHIWLIWRGERKIQNLYFYSSSITGRDTIGPPHLTLL